MSVALGSSVTSWRTRRLSACADLLVAEAPRKPVCSSSDWSEEARSVGKTWEADHFLLSLTLRSPYSWSLAVVTRTCLCFRFEPAWVQLILMIKLHML